MYFLSILTQIEWKVPIHIEEMSSSIKFATLSLISLAALFVKVIAKILHDGTCDSSIKYAILEVTTLVLPLPAPAKISKGPSVAKRASFCLSFSVFISMTSPYC